MYNVITCRLNEIARAVAFDHNFDKDNPHLRLTAASASPRHSKLLYSPVTAEL